MALLKNSLLLQGRVRHAAAAASFTARRGAATSTEEYQRRNYAENASEYNTVMGSLVAQRRQGNIGFRPYLLRDAYDDMMLDGVQPVRDTFHTLIVGTMKGSRLQDALYFRDQMKEMGLQPDVNIYNFLISTCGKCKNSDAAIMVVSDMSAAGLGLNKFCYAGLITAFKNKTPTTEETMAKILHFVEQSKGWQYVERVSKDSAENIMMNVSEEELYNLPTAEYVNRRGGFVLKQFTVYHAAIHACAELGSKETLEALLDMFNKDNRDGSTYDAFMAMQAMRCYLRCGDIDSAVKMFEEYTSSRFPAAELYVTLAEGAMIGHTPRGMQVAQETIVIFFSIGVSVLLYSLAGFKILKFYISIIFQEKMVSRNFFLNPRMGTDLLLAAAGERTGGYTTANYVWDLLQSRNITPSLPAVEAYHKGLKERQIPSDDPRLLHVTRVLDNLNLRFGPRRNIQ
ncbi:Pentatricopeptide repeat-containing protein [Dichanthelium oligosanthes]|uniref:Pentatricopeptide repeat-containing protein n=1 Tax=Dichanthelium oligosanthes TaxID=888268 RepID=A0A1E5V8I6_9POAL|nr:Pentatricopeptide repeat-containing protein [Dichanthelium oligosanthes]